MYVFQLLFFPLHAYVHAYTGYNITFFRTSNNLLDSFARVIINRVSRISPQTDSSGVACGDWSEKEARVVCRQAGFIGLESFRTVVVGPHKTFRKISRLGCNGNESGIAQCTQNLQWIDDKNCGGRKSFAIKCTSETICTTLHANVCTFTYIHACTNFHVTYFSRF